MVIALVMSVGIGCKATAAATTAAAAATTAAAETTAAAAETTAAPAKKLTIGRVMFEYGHPYQQADMKHFKDYADKLGVDTIILDGKSNPETISNNVDDLKAKKVDGIIYQPVDPGSSDTISKASIEAGFPTITFFQRPGTFVAPHVRIDEAKTSYEMGALAAKYMAEFFPGKPIKLGLIDISTVEYVVINRSDTFIAGLLSVAPDAEVVSRLDGGGIRDQSYAAGQDMLQSHPEINLVYGTNADCCLGALAAFEAGGRGKAVDGKPVTEMFISIDGSEGEALKMIDPSSALKITMALQPLYNSHVLMDTILKVVKGDIKITEDIIIDTPDIILDAYAMSIDDIQKFITVDYLSKVDLKAELEKLKK